MYAGETPHAALECLTWDSTSLLAFATHMFVLWILKRTYVRASILPSLREESLRKRSRTSFLSGFQAEGPSIGLEVLAILNPPQINVKHHDISLRYEGQHQLTGRIMASWHRINARNLNPNAQSRLTSQPHSHSSSTHTHNATQGP